MVSTVSSFRLALSKFKVYDFMIYYFYECYCILLRSRDWAFWAAAQRSPWRRCLRGFAVLQNVRILWQFFVFSKMVSEDFVRKWFAGDILRRPRRPFSWFGLSDLRFWAGYILLMRLICHRLASTYSRCLNMFSLATRKCNFRKTNIYIAPTIPNITQKHVTHNRCLNMNSIWQYRKFMPNGELFKWCSVALHYRVTLVGKDENVN